MDFLVKGFTFQYARCILICGVIIFAAQFIIRKMVIWIAAQLIAQINHIRKANARSIVVPGSPIHKSSGYFGRSFISHYVSMILNTTENTGLP